MWWLTRVRSGSMQPALHDGQLVLTRRVRLSSRIRRGDVVVVDSAEVGRRVVKRVVGLPGELVEIAEGAVSIDGRPFPEPYATPSVFTGVFRVPEDRFVLLGDNRDASSDSRTWQQPYVDRGAIVGRLVRWRRTACAVRARVARATRSADTVTCGAAS